jgi:hypothetical protein
MTGPRGVISPVVFCNKYCRRSGLSNQIDTDVCTIVSCTGLHCEMDVPPHQCYTIELQATQGYMLDSGADTTYFLGRTDGAKNVRENEIQNNEAKTKIK